MNDKRVQPETANHAVLCVLVRYTDGSECWWPLRDYSTNPEPGTWIEHAGRTVFEQGDGYEMRTKHGR